MHIVPVSKQYYARNIHLNKGRFVAVDLLDVTFLALDPSLAFDIERYNFARCHATCAFGVFERR